MYRLKIPQLIVSASLILLVTTIFLFGSCSALKRATPTVTDSTTTVINTVERDTSITAPGAATGFNVPLAQVIKAAQEDYNKTHGPSPAFTAATLTPTSLGGIKNKQASASASILNGNLQIECTCDSMAIATKLLDRYLKTDHTRTVTLPPVETKYTPWYFKVLSGIGLGSLALIGLLIYRGIKQKTA